MATSTIKETIDNLLIMNLCYQYGYLDTIQDEEQVMYWSEITTDFDISESYADLGINSISILLKNETGFASYSSRSEVNVMCVHGT
ncbi:MAG: hypothetical protein K5751_00860 [Treponemataceae bacterium]|nr:hypothetical protein [Treponemataceae bacterium]